MAQRALGRYKCTDALGVRSGAVRFVDQAGEGEAEPEGELLCRVMQTSADTWAGHDAKGRVLRIKRGRDGALEIRHMPETGDEADPDVTGVYPGAGGDPARAAGRTGDAMARFARTGKPYHHGAALAEYQRKLDEHYGNRR